MRRPSRPVYRESICARRFRAALTHGGLRVRNPYGIAARHPPLSRSPTRPLHVPPVVYTPYPKVMGRIGFLLGLLTGLVFALSVMIRPQPRIPPPAGPFAALAPGAYRMRGVMQRDTCGVRAAPWPDRWVVSADGLGVGQRVFRGRPSRAGIVYEAVQHDLDACLTAAWIIKLTPSGDGFSGTASWEVGGAGDRTCVPPPGVPCTREAQVFGYPIAED